MRLSTVFSTIFCVFLISACSSLPQPPASVALYDLGPGLQTPASGRAPSADSAQRPALSLDEIQAQGLLDTSAALSYRLAYSDAQQLRPYRQARWSQPPAQLVQSRIAEHLGQDRAILQAKDNPQNPEANAPRPALLRLELQEFSQVFTSADASHGLLRLRATLVQPVPAGEVLIAQQVFTAQASASSPDAAAGAAALAQTVEASAAQIAAWLKALGR